MHRSSGYTQTPFWPITPSAATKADVLGGKRKRRAMAAPPTARSGVLRRTKRRQL